MTSIVIFALEGVLRSDGGRPAEAACRLYRTLRGSLLHQTGIITSGSDTAARRFLDAQHMPAASFITPDLPATHLDWSAACQEIRRAYPYDIDFIITPDPDTAAQLYHDGFRVMLWTDPRYSRPEFRPDALPRQASSWAALADGLQAGKALIASDDRISTR